MASLNAAVLGAALAVSGCNVFDPALYMGRPAPDAAAPADAAPPPDLAENEVAPEVGPPDVGGVGPALADVCEESTPLQSTSTMFAIDTTTLKANYRELTACVGHELPGNDGFLSIDMAAGEKWHVHVNPGSADFDPAVYILNSCDERACSKVTAIDECGPGKSEHLSFKAPQNGRYRVGIDSPTAGGGQATVVIVKPVCGNGMIDHSETCDETSETCEACRKKLAMPSVSEAEPNDDPSAANVLAAAQRAGGQMVLGQVATRCDHDLFSVTVAAMGTIRAAVAATTVACADGGAIWLSLVGPDGQTELRAGTAQPNGCPTLEVRDLAAGEYFVQVRRTGTEAPWPYQLVVEAP